MPQQIEPCAVCGKDCDGSLMRTNPRYTRVRDMLEADEVSRMMFRNGIRVCHFCQRDMYFAGGFNELLQKELKRAIYWRQRRPVSS